MNDNRKAVIITGATSGIGKAVAETLHAAGYGLVITGRMSPDEYMNNKLQAIQLKYQLDMANASVTMQKELLHIDNASIPGFMETIKVLAEKAEINSKKNRSHKF